MGRPTRRHDPRGTVVTYGYGQGGHRTELTVEGQGTAYYAYNEVGNMTAVLDGKTGLFTYYEYDPAGRVRLQHHPNATATYFVNDAAGRLGEKVTKKDSDASVLVRFAYTRDAAGNPIAIEREPALGAFYYEYDQLQRLAYEGQFISGDREYENYYEYDAAGNRTLLRHGETGAEDLTYYAYDAANELTSLHDKDGWTYFGYDQNGNTAMEQAPGYTRYFDWDGRDMLIGVRSTEQGWTDNEIRYDGLASRAELVDSTGTTRYAWDGIRVLKLEDEERGLKQRQVHGYAPIPSVGDIALIESAEGDPYAPIADQVGTVVKVLGSGATVANSYQYDAFGVSRGVTESFANPFRFAGKPLDPDPVLYHFIARQYNPTVGRFMTLDPGARFDQSARYDYVYGAPTSFVDPLGTDRIVVHGRAVVWVTQKKGLLHDVDSASYTVGELVDDHLVKLLEQPWGGGCIELRALEALAKQRFLGDMDWQHQKAEIEYMLRHRDPEISERWWSPQSMWWQHYKGTSPALSPDWDEYRRAYESNRFPLDKYFDPLILPWGPVAFAGSEFGARYFERRAVEAATSRFASTGLRHGAYVYGLRPGYWRVAGGIRLAGRVNLGVSFFYGGWHLGNFVQAWWHAYDFVYTEP